MKFYLYEIVQYITILDDKQLGDEVYKILEPKIKKCFANNTKFVIDFSNIDAITTEFLYKAIGNIFVHFENEKLSSLISFSGLDVKKRDVLKWVISNTLCKED